MRELRVLGLAAEHRFEVTEPSYRSAAGVLARGRLRWGSYVSYPRNLALRLRRSDVPDAVVVCTNTFYAPAVALRAAARRRVPVVSWIFDLFPDVLVAGGKIRAGGMLDRSLGRLTRSVFRGAAANVFLGERLRRYAEARYGEGQRSLVIPVGADGTALAHSVPASRTPGDPLGILYCGNLGRMHETATLADLMREPGIAGWRMEFRGHGAGFRDLASVAARSGLGDRVLFGGSLADSVWATTMQAADIALVTMKPGAEGLVIPSKTYSAMVAGQAVLAICPLESDLADTIRADDAGWVVAPGDVAGLRAVLATAVARPDEVLAKRRNAFRAGRERYDQKVLAARWVELLSTVASARR